MKDLRERCKQFIKKHAKAVGIASVESIGILALDLESFAREIRNEALEEAAKAVSESDPDGQHELCADEIRALKTNALAAGGPEEKA